MAPVVLVPHSTSVPPAVGGLFNGLAFFLLQRLPSRASYVDRLQANGGRVVKLEQQADHVIADHVKSGCPSGSISYTFIDAAIKDGTLPDPKDHLAGPAPGTVRPVGSTVAPGKRTRTAFTAEDDRVLWEWVERARSEGGSVKGNEIYKQLEAKNSRHPHQAWRDRYIKQLMGKPPPGVEVKLAANAPSNAPPNPPVAPNKDADEGEEEEEEVTAGFSKDDFESLTAEAADIVALGEDRVEEAWQAFATAWPAHTAEEWRTYWEDTILPAFKETPAYPEVIAGIEQKRREEEEKAERRAERRRKRTAREKSVDEEPRAKRRDKQDVKEDRDLKSANEASTARQTPVKLEEMSHTHKQKRRREDSVPQSASQPRRKKHVSSAADFADLFTSDEEVDGLLVPPQPRSSKRAVIADDPIEDLSTDREVEGIPNRSSMKVKKTVHEKKGERREHAQIPVKQRRQARGDVADEADEQLRGELAASQNDERPTLVDVDDLSELPTSDANRAAEQQVRRGSAESMQMDGELGEASDKVIGAKHVEKDGAVEDGLPGDQPDSKSKVPPVSNDVDVEGLVEPRLTRENAMAAIREKMAHNEVESDDGAGCLNSLEHTLANDIDAFDASLQALGEGSFTMAAAGDAGEQTQIRDPVVHAEADGIADEPRDITISNHLIEDGEVEDGVPGEGILDPNGGFRAVVPPGDDASSDDADDSDAGGDALTTANLASQQAEHMAPVVRGIDLPEDDVTEDQGVYASYLQDILALRATAQDALTEANLASQQAAQPKSPVLRGVDLQEDDDAQDQSDLVKYLQSVLASKASPAQPGKGLERDVPVLEEGPSGSLRRPKSVLQQETTREESEYTQHRDQGLSDKAASASQHHTLTFPLRQDGVHDGSTYMQIDMNPSSRASRPTEIGGLADQHLSSQQEVDDVLESSLQWPYSPQQSKSQASVAQENGSMRYETQIPYSSPRIQDGTRSSEIFTTQPRHQLAISYPHLPARTAKPDHDGEQSEVQSQVEAGPDLEIEEGNGYVMVEQAELPEHQNGLDDQYDDDDGVEEEYDIDLEVPEPEEGFVFTSSPERPAAAQRYRGEDQSVDDRGAEGAFNITSPPFRPSPYYNDQQPTQQASPSLESLPEEEEDGADQELADIKSGKIEAIEVSSAESSSSPYQSSEPPSNQAADYPAAKRTRFETQDIINAETQQPDLSMPLPPDSDEDDMRSDDGIAEKLNTTKTHEPETQPPDTDDDSDDPLSDLFIAPFSPAAQRKAAQDMPPRPTQPLRPFKKSPAKSRQAPPTKPTNLAETQTLVEELDINDYFANTQLRLSVSEAAVLAALQATSMRPELADIILHHQKVHREFPRDMPGVWTAEEDAVVEGGNAKLMKGLVVKHGWEEMERRLEYLRQYREADGSTAHTTYPAFKEMTAIDSGQ
ncbi:hypothetical protein LTR94_018955 [Friedmanniomyces endolithicus]|nr:hypothetical protein LTR94_018955 [Friedmanniomyces endolithicus]KAK0781875.1 hypothetical protein LTR38_013608 [Friedmanniomyces endolithicus]KAK0796094.1 hypothetical protein LTR75_010323 [Friedmanniomyces endolithicus]KAK0856121.1 hypothetical protein LTR03_001529 [Friedmanniomyces endolithicus]